MRVSPDSDGPVAMPIGVDDAGSAKPIFDDPFAQRAFDEIRFDFLSYHLGRMPLGEEVRKLDEWASARGKQYLLNNEGGERVRDDSPEYGKPGRFFQLDSETVAFCADSPRFLGVCYDELEHCVLDGGWITIYTKEYAPYFYDARGDTLEQAYEGNLANVQTLMKSRYAPFGQAASHPIVGAEYVFPVLNHLFARAGLAVIPKYLKESVTPVTAAVALGAAKQYDVPYWACLDLWFRGDYPGHSPQALESALLFAYWTGAERTYVENLGYNGSLYAETEDSVRLSPWGEVVRDFRKSYLPQHPRAIRVRDFRPEIVIVRFPDSDWGQEPTGTWITGDLYGAPNLKPNQETRYWIEIWRVLTHGRLPIDAVNYNNLESEAEFRFFFPANNVAVYDHLAADPALYADAKLIFLTGKSIDPKTMKTIERIGRQRGVTIVSMTHLAPGHRGKNDAKRTWTEHKTGKGRWIVTDDVANPEVVAELKPYLGDENVTRFRFGGSEVVFTQPDPEQPIRAEIR